VLGLPACYGTPDGGLRARSRARAPTTAQPMGHRSADLWLAGQGVERCSVRVTGPLESGPAGPLNGIPLGHRATSLGPTSLTACSHSRICVGTMRCSCLLGCAPPSVSLPSRLRRCRRVPGSAQMPAGCQRGPWPVPSGLATSPLASGRCWPSVTAHRCEDGSRRPPSLTLGTWPPPSPAGGHALGLVVSSSSPLRPAVPWRAAASPAG
jgi:hypothetical protein